MFVMGSLGEMVCQSGLSAMAIQVWQGGMVVKVCLRVAWVVESLSWVVYLRSLLWVV